MHVKYKMYAMECPINVNFKTCSSETIDNKINIQFWLKFLFIKSQTELSLNIGQQINVHIIIDLI